MRILAQVQDVAGSIHTSWKNQLPSALLPFSDSIELEYSSSISGEAQQRGNKILISDKFLSLPEDSQFWVLTHELGHWYRERFIDLDRIVPWNSPFGNSVLTNGNSEEDFAESFVSYFLAPNEFKSKHPELYSAMETLL